MKVTLVGTSCTWYTRNNTSYILDDKMLFDVSDGNYKKIIGYINIFDLTAVYISHWHSDHIGNLNVLMTRMIRESDRNGRKEKLRVYAKKGMAEHIIEMNLLAHAREDETSIDLLKKYVEFIDISDGMEFDESGYHIKVYKMDHYDIDCFGFTFEDKDGKVVAFSADTRQCDNLEKMLEKSDVAFVDMAAVTESLAHLDYDNFVKLSKKYTSCKMIPIHTSDKTQKLAEENGLNYVHDGDIINI